MQYAGTYEDERELMARIAGGLWLVAGLVSLAGQAVPGVEHDHLLVLLAIAVPVCAHGLTCLYAVPWTRVPLRVHGLSTAAMLPLVGMAIWATGGADSYVKPLLLLPVLFFGYFYPLRWSLALTTELIVVAASPLAIGSVPDRFFPWLFTFAITVYAANLAVAKLKQRLVAAERRQRQMAHRDPLTGVANRRAFDATLDKAVADGKPFALLVIDLDDFKGINDGWGHPTGDRVLREIAAHCAAVVREGDCLARVGGDEFAVIAPGARAEGARRLAASLEAAVAQVRRGDGDAAMAATVSAAVYPDEGRTAAELVGLADGALHARKRAQRSVAKDVRSA